MTSNPLCWTRGDTAILNGVATVAVGGLSVPYTLDPTTQVLRFTAKKNYTDADASAILGVSSTGGGIVVTNGGSGQFQITIRPEDYQGIAANPIASPLSLKYDLQVAGANGENVYTLALGQLTLTPDVTTTEP